MSDRLIELLQNRSCFYNECKGKRRCGNCDCVPINGDNINNIVDYLLANGVVVLPCKVGTEVYLSDYIDKHHRLKEYKFIGNKIAVVIECWELQRTCTRWLDDFGKTIFLAREEAERALKGGE